MPLSIGIVVYRLVVWAYYMLLKLFAFFGHNKAQSWVNGRKNWQQKIGELSTDSRDKIWIHCASLGEYEMAVPLIQQLKLKYPGNAIVISFFSPSGYEYCTDISHYDYKLYLPIDSRSNAEFFVGEISPCLAIFVKYELWYFYINQLNKRKVPSFLINVRFKKDAVFFKWYGVLHCKMLQLFSKVFVNDEQSLNLVEEILPQNKLILSSDSRFERVLAIKNEVYSIKDFEVFSRDCDTLILGSSYSDEESIALEFLRKYTGDFKCIIAPHNIESDRILSIQNNFQEFHPLLITKWTSYSTEEIGKSRVLIIDSIGQLSRIYRYADLAIVGGGFNGALHNVYEALVYKIPVFFGSNFGEENNWQDLLDRELAFSFNSYKQFEKVATQFMIEEAKLQLKQKVENFWNEKKDSENRVMIEVEKILH